MRNLVLLALGDIFFHSFHVKRVAAFCGRCTDVVLSFKNNTLRKQIVLLRIRVCFCFEVKEASQEPQMVFTARHAAITFQTDGETWREQKEKKAALMVGILIGVFVLCWIPFFITELISPLCSCNIPPVWKSIFLWLGYSNSFFNPLIYTAFNKNYNNAFKNLFVKQR